MSTPLRNASFDYVRLIAVIGIIWFHTKAPHAEIGYSGLSFFLLLLAYLAIMQISQLRDMRYRAPAFLRYAASRGMRLILPWLLVSGLFGLLKLADVMRGADWQTEFTNQMWLTGTAPHLWFLPFAFVTCLAFWPLGRMIKRMRRSVQMSLCIGFAGLSLVALTFWQTAALPAPIAEWAYALPAVCLGVSLALTGGYIWRMYLIAVLFFGFALFADLTHGLLQLGIATTLLLTCTLIKIRPHAAAAFAARASLGVYLIHPAVASILSRSQIIAEQTTLFAICVTLGSLGIIALWDSARKTAPQKSSTFGKHAVVSG